ncbi:MAG: ABC transporter permease [Vulcanimicrobiaceae bacterium]
MNDVLIVYSAEIMRRIKSRPFLIGLVVGLIFLLFIVKAPTLLGGVLGNVGKRIVLAGDPRLTAQAKPLLAHDFTIRRVVTSTSAPAPAQLRAYRVSTVIALSRGANGALRVAVYSRNPGNVHTGMLRRDLLPLNLRLATSLHARRITGLLHIPVTVHSVGAKFASSTAQNAARGIAYTLIVFLYMLILINSQFVMSSVAEEKTSRISELLVASVDATALLAGKVLAAGTLALLLLAIWVGAAVTLGSPAGGAASAAGASPFGLAGLFTGTIITPLVGVGFLVFFVLGFLQLSTMFAAMGALINRTEDLGSLSFPLVMPVIAAFFIAITALAVPHAPWVVAASFIPLLAPFVMFARMAVSNVPAWQILLSVAINVAALWGIALLAGKLYRVGMLLYGRAPNFKQIWTVLRTN